MLTPAELVWLMAAVAKGDQAAFERLYAATRAKLYGVVLRILRRSDLADEVLQETYLKIWNSAGTFDPKRERKQFGKPIAEFDLIRKKTEASLEDEPAAMEAAGEEPNPLARREMTEELRRLLGCLGQLQEDRRRMVLLAYYSGWSREQLSAKFDAPANTIKTWLRRSLMEIRECLGS